VEEGNGFAAAPAINAEIFEAGRNHRISGMQFNQANETEVRDIGAAILVAMGAKRVEGCPGQWFNAG
jgi:hypothetical protein